MCGPPVRRERRSSPQVGTFPVWAWIPHPDRELIFRASSAFAIQYIARYDLLMREPLPRRRCADTGRWPGQLTALAAAGPQGVTIASDFTSSGADIRGCTRRRDPEDGMEHVSWAREPLGRGSRVSLSTIRRVGRDRALRPSYVRWTLVGGSPVVIPGEGPTIPIT